MSDNESNGVRNIRMNLFILIRKVCLWNETAKEMQNCNIQAIFPIVWNYLIIFQCVIFSLNFRYNKDIKFQ